MENSSFRLCVTSLLYSALFFFCCFFFSTSSLGFTFGCRKKQMILKQTNKQRGEHLKPHTILYTQACLFQWPGHIWHLHQKKWQPRSLQNSCQERKLGTENTVTSVCRESALPSETGVHCSCCTLGTAEGAMDPRGAVQLGREHRPDGLCSQAASLEEWIKATSVSGMLVGWVGRVSVDWRKNKEKTDKSNGHLIQGVRLMGIKASCWTENFKTRSSAFHLDLLEALSRSLSGSRLSHISY